jgi:hypothetical protein
MSYCIKEPSDEQVLRIYARENSTQRGEDNSAQAGPIASAIRLLALASSDAKWRERGDHGIGARNIAALLGCSRNEGVVIIQLANLKASGDYARIIEEVASELGTSAPEQLTKEAARVRVRNPRIFDTQGVQKIIKLPELVETFRKITTSPAMKSALPIERQVDLAKALVDKAKNYTKPDGTPAPKNVSARYLRDEAVGMMLQTKSIGRKIAADERAELERGNWEARAENLMKDVARSTRSIITNMQSLVKHCQSRPKGVKLQQTGDFTDAMENLERIIVMKGKLR